MSKSNERRWRNDLQLRRGVKKLMRELDIGAELDVQVLCDRLAEHRGRPIHLVPYPFPSPGAFGLWVGSAAEDLILYQRDTTHAHQEHIILHEFGHVISDHGTDDDDDDILDRLFPGIPKHVILRRLRREGYGQAVEREAEMVATTIKEWASLLDQLGKHRTASSSAHRLDGAFADHQGWL